MQHHSNHIPTKETSERNRATLGPLHLDCVTLAETMTRIEHAVAGKTSPLHIVTANAQFLGQARRDRSFAEVVQQAGLVVPDGVPLIWLSRLRGAAMATRITGHDLLYASAALAAERGYSVGFLGAGPGVAELAVQRLADRYPTLRTAGIFQGNFSADGAGTSEADEDGVTEAIRLAKPDILFVALGCPKQEMWIARHQRTAGVPVAVGVGGVLDVLAGRFKRAPAWMQSMGLEWVYRLAQDPGRLGKRYLFQDLPTLTICAMGSVRERSDHKRPTA